MEVHLNKNEQNIRIAATYFFITPPILLLLLVLNPASYFPVIGYYAAGATMLGGMYLYVFTSFGFRYIYEHAKPYISYGSAQPEKTSGVTVLALGPQTGGGRKVLVHPEVFSVSTHFLGRWTVYLSEKDKLVLWHDHPIFGGEWYFIQY